MTLISKNIPFSDQNNNIRNQAKNPTELRPELVLVLLSLLVTLDSTFNVSGSQFSHLLSNQFVSWDPSSFL